MARLGANSYIPCPKCGYKIAFFSGDERAFISEEKTFHSETLVKSRCPVHGVFEGPAAEFHNCLEEIGAVSAVK